MDGSLMNILTETCPVCARDLNKGNASNTVPTSGREYHTVCGNSNGRYFQVTVDDDGGCIYPSWHDAMGDIVDNGKFYLEDNSGAQLDIQEITMTPKAYGNLHDWDGSF